MKAIFQLGLWITCTLLFYQTVTASTYYPNLAGAWYVNGKSSSPAYITQSNSQLTFRSGKHYSKGYFTSSQTVKATHWNAKGSIRYNGKQIKWNNQTWYRRSSTGNRSVTGSGTLVTTRAYDYVSASDAFRKDGRADAQFKLSLNSSSYRRIVHIEMRNTNGHYSVWDTRSRNSYWAIAVFKNRKLMNGAGGAISFGINPGHTTLYLNVQDNGSIRAGKTNYKATISYADGNKQVVYIGRSTTTTTTGGTSSSSGGTVSGSGVLVSRSAYDYVSARDAFLRDGKADAQFKLTLNSSKYRRIAKIELRNTNGQYSVWDTKPKNSYWAIAVFKNRKLQNGAGGIVSIPIAPGYTYLYLHVQDNGSIRNQRTKYKAVVFYSDGSKQEIHIR